MTEQFELLYVHLPFCETRCHYCDFYALAAHRTKTEDKLSLYKAIEKEAQNYSNKNSLAPLKAIFMGGGTPSMTEPSQMEKFLKPILKTSGLTQNYEWTIEANPSSIDLDRMKGYKEIGVNRVSIGVQSLDEKILSTLGRVHSKDQATHAIETVFKAGFDNVSVDLMCGLPNQSTDQLRQDIQRLTQYPITHLSCYLLTLGTHHPMYKDLPNEETQIEHLLLIDEELKNQGFEHYEISNFCRDGKKALHNLMVWKGHSYLGLGPSAHSFSKTTQTRWKNIASLKKYTSEILVKNSARSEEETLGKEEQTTEKWMLALRLNDGFPKTWIESDQQKSKLKVLFDQNLIQNHPIKQDYFCLTPRGFMMSDQIVVELSD